MAGATDSIRIDFDDSEIQKALQKLSKLPDNLPAAMLEISGYLDNRTRDHFDNEQEPDGTPWATLSPETLERKEQDSEISIHKKLHGKTQLLRDDIFAFSSADEAGVATGGDTKKYAATHQFGDDDRNIPARPFFGLSDEDETEIIDIIHDHLSRAL